MASRYRLLRRPQKPLHEPHAQPSGTDLSLLQKPMELTLTGALQVARCLSSGTAEMQELLTEECDIIFECRVCRNLFRNLPNFIAHKRHYCQKCYMDTKVNFVETKQETETLVVQPEGPKEPPRVVIPAEEYCAAEKVIHRRKPAKILTNIKAKTDPTVTSATQKVENLPNATNGSLHTEIPKQIVIEGNSDAFKFYTKAVEKIEMQEDSRKRCLVELENVTGNNNAKRQKVKPDAKVEDVRAAYKKATGPTRSDLAIITESFDRVKEEEIDVEEDMDGPRKRNLRQRGGSGEVKTPIADKLSRRKDCDVKTQTCLKCNATYSSLKTLHFHMMSLHSEKATVYPCVYSKCKASFTQIWVAVRHLHRAHGCSKNQIEKLKVHLKKYAYTCPVDDVGNVRKAISGDLSLYRANKRKQAEDYREKVDKVKGEATDTIRNVTKRLADKMKKPKDVHFKFGRSGFTLFRCQNCNKTFAKHDSLSRHSAFCFGIGGLDLEKVCSARLSKPKSTKTDRTRQNVQKSNPEVENVNKVSTEPKPKPNSDEVVTAAGKSIKTQHMTLIRALLSRESKVITHSIKNNNDTDATPEIESKSIDLPKSENESKSIDLPTSESESKSIDLPTSESESKSIDLPISESDSKSVDLPGDIIEETFELSEPEQLNDSLELDTTLKEDLDEKSLLDYISRRRHSELDSTALDKIRGLINEEQLECLKCNRKYGNISNLHRHALRHLGWKRFRCTLCSFTAYNRSECKTHLSRVHLEKSHKFILDLDPEQMKSGISAKSRVESGRQSSLRILEKIQQERRTQQSRDKSLSPSKRSFTDAFNISTRNSPRAFNIRPYQRIEHGAMLFTRSGHYPKPATMNDEQVEETAEQPDEELMNDESTNISEHSLNEEEEESVITTPELSMPEISLGATPHISENTNDTLSPPALIQQTMIPERIEENRETLSPPVLTEQMLVTDNATLVHGVGNGDMQAPEIFYVVVDNGDVNMDTTVITMKTDSPVMDTVTLDTSAQLAPGSGEHNIYVVKDEDGNITAAQDTDLIVSHPDLVGFVEEEVVAGDGDLIVPELKEGVVME